MLPTSEMKVVLPQASKITTKPSNFFTKPLPRLATLVKLKSAWMLLPLNSLKTESMIWTSRTPRMTDHRNSLLRNCQTCMLASLTTIQLFQLKTHLTRMIGKDMPLSLLRLERKFKSLVMTCSLQTPLRSNKLLTRKHATPFY